MADINDILGINLPKEEPGGKRKIIENLIQDLVFSIGQGYSAGGRGAQGRSAGIGAALQGPMVRQQILQQQQNDAQDRAIKIQQLRQAALKGDQDAALRLREAMSGSIAPTESVTTTGLPLPVTMDTEQRLPPVQYPLGGGRTMSMPVTSAQDAIRQSGMAEEQKARIQAQFREPEYFNTPGGTIQKGKPGFIEGTTPKPEPFQPRHISSYTNNKNENVEVFLGQDGKPYEVVGGKVRVPPPSMAIQVGGATQEALGGMPSDLSDAFNRATMSMQPAKRLQVATTVGSMLKRGDQAGVRATIKQAALEGEPEAAVRAQVRGRREVTKALTDIEALLKAVPTNLIAGTIEDTARKLGTTSNEEYVKLGTRLRVLNQAYRRSMTGAQFSVPEAKEYASIFPSYSNTAPVNKAEIAALREAFGANDAVYWDNKLGPGWADAPTPEQPAAAGAGGWTVKVKPK